MQRLRGSLCRGRDDDAGRASSKPFIGAARFSESRATEGEGEGEGEGGGSDFGRGAAFLARGGGGGGVELPQFIRAVLVETGYEEWVRHGGGASDGVDRWGNLRELANLAAGYPASDVGLLHFLDEMSLLGDTDAVLSNRAGAAARGSSGETSHAARLAPGAAQSTVSPADIPTVQLMTVHAAKGLEFDTVFVVGFEEDLLPHFHSQEHARDVEEERRLAYVAASRAKQHLRFTCARRRLLWGSPKLCEPSRFLGAVSGGLIMPMGSF